MLKSVSAALIVIVTLVPVRFTAQGFGNLQRETGRQMFRDMMDAVWKNYYDPKLRGIDVEALFKAADDRIRAALWGDRGIHLQFHADVRGLLQLSRGVYA